MVVAMTDNAQMSARRRGTYAARLPHPQACGCGLPVAFDPAKHEFFCIGCGASTLCTCRTTLTGSAGRPVKVT